MAMDINRQAIALGFGLHVAIHYFARGTYPCRERNTYPVNRMLFILDPGEGGWIGDVPIKAGRMVVAPAFREVLFQFSATTYFISLHFNMDFYCGKDLWGERLDSVRYLDSVELTAEVVRIFEHRERFYQIAALKALLYRLTGIMLPHSEMTMPNFRIIVNF